MADYTIKEGDTLSAIASANKTTVDALVKANSIADPNKINAGAILKLPTTNTETTMTGADINASQIKSGAPVVEPPVTPVKTPTDANAISAYTDEQLKRIEKERADVAKAAGTDATKTTTEQIVSLAETRPTIDTATTRKQQMQESGATAISSDLQLANTKLGTLKGEVEGLDAKEQAEIDALEQVGMTRGAIDREKAVIQRKYASQKAYKNSEYLVQAATVAALQGNYTIASNIANQAIEDYTYDYQQNVKTFDTLFSVYSDALKDLDTDEQNVLKVAAQNAKDELEKVTKEKTDISNLMLNYPNAGITLGDSLDTATQKATNYEKTHPTISSTIGSAETGYTFLDKYGNVIGTKAGSGTASGISKTTLEDLSNDLAYMTTSFKDRNSAESWLNQVRGSIILRYGDTGYTQFVNELNRIFPQEQPKPEVKNDNWINKAGDWFNSISTKTNTPATKAPSQQDWEQIGKGAEFNFINNLFGQ